jgi:hypothetical protein
MKPIAALIVAALAAGCAAGEAPVASRAATLGPTQQTPFESPTDVEPSSSAAASETQAVGADALTLRWTEVELDGLITHVIGDTSRFVAVGRGSDGVSSWTSTEGTTWEEHDVPERSFGEIGDGVELTGSMGRLVRLGDTLYSFGEMSFMDSVQGSAWRWTDGSDWEVIESSSAFFSGRPTSVAASDDALLAGILSFELGLFGTHSTWLWMPATSWAKTALSSSPDEEISVDHLAWGGGTYVAVGFIAPRVEGVDRWDWPKTPSIWTSSEGLEWTAIQPPDGMTSVCALTPVAGGGFVALAMAGDRPAAWTSTAGDQWVEASLESPPATAVRDLTGLAWRCNVVEVAGALLATASTENRTLTWTSTDSRSWAFGERLDIATRADAALESRVLIVGTVEDTDAPDGFRQVILIGDSQ